MARPISDSRIFYVSVTDADGNPLYEAVNPLAHEITIAHIDKTTTVCSWFDMANQSMRSIPVSSYEHHERDKYLVKDVYGSTYIFEYVNRPLYEKHVHPICPGSPESFDTDDEVQRFLQKSMLT